MLRLSSILDLRLASEQAYQKLLVDVKSVREICDVPFQELLEALELLHMVDQYGKESTEGVDAVIQNPPYNPCQIAESP